MALNPKVKRSICLSIGIFILVLGCVLIPVFRIVIHNTIVNDLPLKKGSISYGDWIVPPVPIYFQIWIFDLKNPLEVVKRGAKPFVVERGPYTYREHRKKVNITFESNNTVTYREIKWYVFERGKSVGRETDDFTTVNIAMVTLANLIRFEYNWITELAELILDATEDSNLFARYTVRDVMWGIQDPLLTKVNDIMKKYNNSVDDRVGLFYGENNTDDGWYNVYTGKGDIGKLGIINTWNGLTELSYWTSDSCNRINGTDATLYPPFVKKTDTLYAFSSDICRSIYAQFKEKKQLKGVELLSFYVPDILFADIPENHGFCTPAGNCLPAGLLNVSNCKQESAPIVMSQPHFFAANQSLINAIGGLHPKSKVHQTIIDVEPNTGIVMNVAKRLQVNIYIQNISNIRDTALIDGLFYPIIWLNESATIDNKMAKKYKSEVQTPIDATLAVQYSLIVLGTFITISVLFYIAILYFKRKDTRFETERSKILEDS